MGEERAALRVVGLGGDRFAGSLEEEVVGCWSVVGGGSESGGVDSDEVADPPLRLVRI